MFFIYFFAFFLVLLFEQICEIISAWFSPGRWELTAADFAVKVLFCYCWTEILERLEALSGVCGELL